MANTKLTKKEKFNMVLEIVKGNEMLEEFINHELELLEKKSGSKGQTKTQKENEVLKEELVKAFAEFDTPITISDFCSKSSNLVASLSNQKISALLRQLVAEGKMVRIEEKKKAYFSVV